MKERCRTVDSVAVQVAHFDYSGKIDWIELIKTALTKFVAVNDYLTVTLDGVKTAASFKHRSGLGYELYISGELPEAEVVRHRSDFKVAVKEINEAR